jgi:hypothetical protein
VCPDWVTLREQFDQLPVPLLRLDEEGETDRQGWIFRGHKDERYRLSPSIEREYLYTDWNHAEYKALREFQSKAGMHMDPAQLPEPADRFGWLAIMQHYGAPTRLLDFTYSPYVAMYFALRNRKKDSSAFAEVWGLDAAALRERAADTSRKADAAVREHSKLPAPKSHSVSMAIEDATSSLQRTQEEDLFWDESIRNALNPCGARREHYNRNGFVAEASPTNHNPRLSGQQGVFLFNGAESRLFEDSLESMMDGLEPAWYKRFRIPDAAIRQVEERLFQLNVHDLSLFPDTEGLAGFVRQKIHLHW